MDVNPRANGFNYGVGWGSSAKPPIYYQAQKIAELLNAEANSATHTAWALEMAIRTVRLAETDIEKKQSVAALSVEVAKHRKGIEYTETGDVQCDLHLREVNFLAGQAQIEAHDKMVQRLAPFVWLEDEQLDLARFAETVAKRLTDWATSERERRRAVCPEEFEHLVA